jgi:hypothetical protein
MSASDAAGNPASLTQTLTVDTIAPAIAITGGATATTTDLDPTISGTSVAAPGTTITVSIAGQIMTTLLQANGTWNATPTPVGQGTWQVLAAAPDPAGNVGRATQTLTIATDPSVDARGTGTTGGTAPTGGTGTAGGPGSIRTATRMRVWLSAAGFRAARGHRIQLPFVLNAPAKVTLTLLRGTRVVGKLSTTRRKAGRASLTWDGKIKRQLAPRGTYEIVLRAISPAGTASDTATIRIT